MPLLPATQVMCLGLNSNSLRPRDNLLTRLPVCTAQDQALVFYQPPTSPPSSPIPASTMLRYKQPLELDQEELSLVIQALGRMVITPASCPTQLLNPLYPQLLVIPISMVPAIPGFTTTTDLTLASRATRPELPLPCRSPARAKGIQPRCQRQHHVQPRSSFSPRGAVARMLWIQGLQLLAILLGKRKCTPLELFEAFC